MQDGKDQNAQQTVVEKVKAATNILVAVAANPSVDALSAALGLSLLLNKLDKHATAVFSGKIPPAITFLEPDKAFEHTVDSLRDFIIALDKDKADRLRYKVEDDVVRIFITPYKTTITDKDLKFSQGDFNVDLIIALGAEERDDLDTAITAHGRILHDAAVVTVNTGSQAGNLGNVDWQDPSASSLCEMLVALADALQPSAMDQQIATALLTGVVAETDRFSNQRTTSRAMTIAAQLMGAGANQQLIAAKLQEGHAVSPEAGSTSVSAKKITDGVQPIPDATPTKKDGEIVVDHGAAARPETAAAESSSQPVNRPLKPLASPRAETTPPSTEPKLPEIEKILDQTIAAAPSSAPGKPTLEDLHKDLEAASREIDVDSQRVAMSPTSDWRDRDIDSPSLGGTLNATTYEAEEARREEEESHRNKRILSHDAPMMSYEPKIDDSRVDDAKTEPPEITPELPAPAPVDMAPVISPTPVVPPIAPIEIPTPAAVPPEPAPAAPTLADLESNIKTEAVAPTSTAPPEPQVSAIDSARAAVDAALRSQPFSPAGQPLQSVSAQPLPQQPAEPQPPTPQVELPQPPQPPIPPMPDFSTLPPLMPQGKHVDVSPYAPLNPSPVSTPPVTPTTPTAPSVVPPAPTDVIDPGQFKIPGQP